jgi:hypothetical protein
MIFLFGARSACLNSPTRIGPRPALGVVWVASVGAGGSRMSDNKHIQLYRTEQNSDPPLRYHIVSCPALTPRGRNLPRFLQLWLMGKMHAGWGSEAQRSDKAIENEGAVSDEGVRSRDKQKQPPTPASRSQRLARVKKGKRGVPIRR